MLPPTRSVRHINDIKCTGCDKYKFSSTKPSKFQYCFTCNKKNSKLLTHNCKGCNIPITEKQFDTYEACFTCTTQKIYDCEFCNNKISKYQDKVYGKCYDCSVKNLNCPTCDITKINNAQFIKYKRCFECSQELRKKPLIFTNEDLTFV